MTAPVSWPSWLPIPKRVGHGYQADDVVARSEMNGGAARLRRMFTAAPTRFSVSFQLQPESWPMFDGFWAWSCKRGAGTFLLPIESGLGKVTLTARFIGTPSFDVSDAPGKGRVTATVEILDPVILDEDTYDVISDDFGGSPIAYMAWLDRFEIWVNSDLPNSTLGA